MQSRHLHLRRRPEPLRILSLALAGAALVGGCRSRPQVEQDKALAAIRDGSAKTALQQYFNAHRQCGRAFATYRADGLMEASVGNPVAPALAAAGLIVPVPAPPGTGNDRDRRFYRPAPAAARWYGPPPRRGASYTLCYARRQVRSVWLDPDSQVPALRYSYALVDPAPWAAAGPVPHAVPTLAAALSQVEFYGQDGFIPFRAGKVRLNSIQRTEDDPVLFQFGVNFEGLGVPAAG